MRATNLPSRARPDRMRIAEGDRSIASAGVSTGSVAAVATTACADLGRLALLGFNLARDVTPAFLAWVNLVEHEGVLDIVSKYINL